MTENKLVYLACPYSHPDKLVRVERFEAANRCAAILMRLGALVFSPISHFHPIAEHGLPEGWEFFERFDMVFLELSKAVLVCAVDGWQKSRGVTAERGVAAELGIPVGYLRKPFDEKDVESTIRRAGLL